MDKNRFYRAIPKVDTLIEQCEAAGLFARFGREITVECIREQTEALRQFIAESSDEAEIASRTERLTAEIAAAAEKRFTPNLRPVINATGTVLHTNLGRAPISKKHAEQLVSLVSGYSNLEYDLSAGARGERYSHFERLLCRITGAEAAMAVNNNAAAVMLTLSALCRGGEVPVSRGELVEIGGKFRIPDVMAQSGASMVEVGTTNKTHLSDYEDAINESTVALLKVHTSNFRVVGFSESVSVAELAELAHSHDLPVIEDIGSGVLIDLSKYGLAYEPTVQESLNSGADIVCFSGDKLLGGPQAGIIVGRGDLIKKIKKHPLTRAFRIDKFTAAALELTLQEYQAEERAISDLPVMQMLTMPYMAIRERAERLRELLSGVKAEIELTDCESQVGGGSMPLERLRSCAVAIRPLGISTAALEEALRSAAYPVVCRVQEDRLFMDMRTVQEGEGQLIAAEIREILGEK